MAESTDVSSRNPGEEGSMSFSEFGQAFADQAETNLTEDKALIQIAAGQQAVNEIRSLLDQFRLRERAVEEENYEARASGLPERTTLPNMENNLEIWAFYLQNQEATERRWNHLRNEVRLVEQAISVLETALGRSFDENTRSIHEQALNKRRQWLANFETGNVPAELRGQNLLPQENDRNETERSYVTTTSPIITRAQDEQQRIREQLAEEALPPEVRQAREEATQLRRQNEKFRERLANERELRRQAEEKQIELQQQLEHTQEALQKIAEGNIPITDADIDEERDPQVKDAFIKAKRSQEQQAERIREIEQQRDNANREIELILDREDGQLNADELVWLLDQGHFPQERLTPRERRTLADAGQLNIGRAERLAAWRDDRVEQIRDFLGNISGRVTEFISNNRLALAEVGGVAALRLLFINLGFPPSLAEVAIAPIAGVGLNMLEGAPIVQVAETRYPRFATLARTIATHAPRVGFGIGIGAATGLAWQEIDHRQAEAAAQATQDKNTQPAQKIIKEHIYPYGTKFDANGNPIFPQPPPGSIPGGAELHFPVSAAIDQNVWHTIETNLNQWVPGADKLSPFGHQYLTDAVKDLTRDSRGTINFTADVQHQIGQHLSRALEQNIQNGSFRAEGGTEPDISALKNFVQLLMRAK